jgi:hypothetical protein
MPIRKSVLSFICGVLVLFFGCRMGASQETGTQEKMNDVEIAKGELEAVADSTAQANERLSKIEKELADYKKANDAKVKQVGNFNFSGDVRVRYEGFFQEGTATRNRERLRLRFNVTGKLSDEFSGGFSLATGTLDDPVSTNQTMTGALNRKNIGIDKAYISYKPNFAKGVLKLDAGKFAFPWYRTGLTFDSDVNPEGFAETLSFNTKSDVVKNITFVGFQLPINEVSAGSDSFIFGGQVQAVFQFGSKFKLSLYEAGVHFENPDVLATSQFGSSPTLKPSLSNTNTLRYGTNNSVIGYANGFSYLDTIIKMELDVHPRFPIMMQFDYVKNTEISKEDKAYWMDFMVGKTKEAKDVQFGYSYIRTEKDAVLGALSESDLRAATNVENHRIQFAYLFAKNVTGQFTGWFGKKAIATPEDKMLKRLQFDIVYKF